MKANSQFDYIIVGGGLSGLHLSYSLLNDKYFNNHKILIIDKNSERVSAEVLNFPCIALVEV